MKRLFIFAAYDPVANIIDDSVIMYVRALSELGDVIFYMDNDIPTSELKKLKPFTIYAGGKHHGEYDFGSYKFGYEYARDKRDNYDMLYFVNDSVYLLGDIRTVLESLESQNTDAVGMVLNRHKTKPHIQSWFFGMRPRVFLSSWFDDFIMSVTKQDKGMVTWLYENGFTRLMCKHGWTYTTAFNVTGHAVYNDIKKLFVCGFPFMKKASFVRKHGALGRQINYILNHVSVPTRDAILQNANRVFGEKHLAHILTHNPFKILFRRIHHTLKKIFIEGI